MIPNNTGVNNIHTLNVCMLLTPVLLSMEIPADSQPYYYFSKNIYQYTPHRQLASYPAFPTRVRGYQQLASYPAFPTRVRGYRQLTSYPAFPTWVWGYQQLASYPALPTWVRGYQQKGTMSCKMDMHLQRQVFAKRKMYIICVQVTLHLPPCSWSLVYPLSHSTPPSSLWSWCSVWLPSRMPMMI